MRHGYAVAHAPLFDWNAMPTGVGSLTTTFAAGEGPRLVTTTVYVTFCPGLALRGPVFMVDKSACAPTFVVLLAVLLPGTRSFVVADTVAVFVTLPAKLGD